jgi:hypothetical protein
MLQSTSEIAGLSHEKGKEGKRDLNFEPPSVNYDNAIGSKF